MRQLLLPVTVCLLAGLSSAVPADTRPEVQIVLTQSVDPACAAAFVGQAAATVTPQMAAPGSCITYRLDVVNHGGQTARAVTVSAPIPAHTRLYRLLQPVTPDVVMVETWLEQQADGQKVVKATLAELPVGAEAQVTLEYRVQVL